MKRCMSLYLFLAVLALALGPWSGPARGYTPPLKDITGPTVSLIFDTVYVYWEVIDPVKNETVRDDKSFPVGTTIPTSAAENGIVYFKVIRYLPTWPPAPIKQYFVYSTYDPLRGWITESSPEYSPDGTLTKCLVSQGGVFIFLHEYDEGTEQHSDVEVRIYDPEKGAWQSTSEPFQKTKCVPTDFVAGRVAYAFIERVYDADFDDNVHMGIYDGGWIKEWKVAVEPSGLAVDLDDTVRWYSQGYLNEYGYNWNVIPPWGPGYTAPKSYFWAGPTTGKAPLAVWFLDMAIGCHEVLYDFGDGGTSNWRSLYHLYDNPGSYRATYTVTRLALTDTSDRIITVGRENALPTLLLLLDE